MEVKSGKKERRGEERRGEERRGEDGRREDDNVFFYNYPRTMQRMAVDDSTEAALLKEDNIQPKSWWRCHVQRFWCTRRLTM